MDDLLIQNPAREREDELKIQQERERTYSKSSKRERGLTQNPAREREDLFKIQQEREKELFKIQQEREREREREHLPSNGCEEARPEEEGGGGGDEG